MDGFDIAGFHLSIDREATRAAHAGRARGGAETCDCDACRNFLAQAPERAWPPAAVELLDALGLAPRRDTEVTRLARAADGRHEYVARWHLVGTIERAPLGAEDDLLPAPGGLRLCFRAGGELVPEELAGGPVLELDLGLALPWSIEEREPRL